MQKSEAIAMLGRRWHVDGGSVIFEKIGEADPTREYEFLYLEAAVACLAAARRRRALDEIKRLRKILATPENKVRIWLAKTGLYDRKIVMENIARITEKISLEQAKLDDLESGQFAPEIEHLPDNLDAPVILPLGTPLWKVDYAWPMLADLTITEMRISDIHLYDFGSSREEFDFSPAYTVKPRYEDGRSYGFKYDVAENTENPPMQVDCNIGGVSFFLSLEAALAHAARLAKQVRESASRIDSTIAEAKARIPPWLAGCDQERLKITI